MKLFFSSKRSTISSSLIIMSIIALLPISNRFEEPPVRSALTLILISLMFLLPEIIYMLRSPAAIWKRWTRASESDDQQKRIMRAITGDVTPIKYSSRFRYATFAPKRQGKPYFTTLKKCSCPDFAGRRVACKHMYWLANEMGLLDDGKIVA